MNKFRSLITGVVHSKPILNKLRTPMKTQQICHHDEGFPQPFDNMPFNVTNRYVATLFFSAFFGLGLWAPFIILWYSMAKRAL